MARALSLKFQLLNKLPLPFDIYLNQRSSPMNHFSKSPSSEIFIIEDDPILATLFQSNLDKFFHQKNLNYQTRIFSNAIDAISAMPEDCLAPRLLILDILLTGPDGFTLLNELASYPDLAKIPVIIVSSLHFSMPILEAYNVKKILNKTTMHPSDLLRAVQEVLSMKASSNEPSKF